VSEPAWTRVEESGIDPASVFCHPDLLGKGPEVLAYYLHSAALSRKGLARLTRVFAPRTSGGTRAERQAKVVNRHISSLIEVDRRFLAAGPALRAMSFGSEVNGSWRNLVGSIGASAVKRLLVAHLAEAGHIASLTSSDGRTLASADDISVVRRVTLANGYVVQFGAEPDIAVRDPEGVLQVAIEVKAGSDDAGALERYGACKKSFDKAFDENRAVHTIYLASAITRGVQRAMERDRLVREVHNLGDVLSDEEPRRAFLERVDWLLHLPRGSA
jgi:hypothetical protein